MRRLLHGLAAVGGGRESILDKCEVSSEGQPATSDEESSEGVPLSHDEKEYEKGSFCSVQ